MITKVLALVAAFEATLGWVLEYLCYLAIGHPIENANRSESPAHHVRIHSPIQIPETDHWFGKERTSEYYYSAANCKCSSIAYCSDGEDYLGAAKCSNPEQNRGGFLFELAPSRTLGCGTNQWIVLRRQNLRTQRDR